MADVNRTHQNYQQDRITPQPARRINNKKNITLNTTEVDQLSRTDQSYNIANQPEDSGSVMFARPGLQKTLLRKLKRGDYPIEDALDLHGLRKLEAEDALEAFLLDALERNFSCVLIIHGKGFRSENKQGNIKAINTELANRDCHGKSLLLRATQRRRNRRGVCFT